jgi:hypothetical protein
MFLSCSIAISNLELTDFDHLRPISHSWSLLMRRLPITTECSSGRSGSSALDIKVTHCSETMPKDGFQLGRASLAGPAKPIRPMMGIKPAAEQR